MANSGSLLLHGFPTLSEFIFGVGKAIVMAPFEIARQAFCRHRKCREYNEHYKKCLSCGKLIEIEKPE